MTKKEAANLKAGDRVVNRDGVEYKVIRVYPGWHGFLSSRELEKVKDKPDWYGITVRDRPFLMYEHKDLWLVK